MRASIFLAWGSQGTLNQVLCTHREQAEEQIAEEFPLAGEEGRSTGLAACATASSSLLKAGLSREPR